MKKIILLILTACSLVFGQDFGTLTGSVIDKETGEKLIGANIVLQAKQIGATTDANGEYLISNIPPGKYNISVSYIGYLQFTLSNYIVSAGITDTVNFALSPGTIINEEVVVTGERMNVSQNIAASIAIVDGKHKNHNAGRKKYMSVTSNYQPAHNTNEFSKIDDNPYFNSIEQPLSTFSADVDVASYSTCRRFLTHSHLPYKDAVRIEEFINYFSYDYKKPKGDNPLSINLEYSECPWNNEHKLVHIGLKGKELEKRENIPNNLVFLLDVSGSMNYPDKLPLLKRSFEMLVDQLGENDRVAIVVYAGSAGLVLPSTSGENKTKIIHAITNLTAGGSTAGGDGIKLAYKVAEENFIDGGNNRVILATDGDFNIGISSTSELERLIEKKRESGVYLTVLGFGLDNLKDNRMQTLADKGNGNHAYIDNLLEAKKVLVNEMNSTLFTIAKDVKIQVEFNPAKVKSYRLVGYENRLLNNKDFEDDTKDAGEIGSGHTVTALYEIIPNDGKLSDSDLKYVESKIKDSALSSDELLTVRIRYKQPDGDKSKEFSEVLKDAPNKLDNSSENFRWSAAVAEFALLLRESEYKGNANIAEVKKLARSAQGEDKFGYRNDFLTLVNHAEVAIERKLERE